MHKIILSVGTNFNYEQNAKLVKKKLTEEINEIQFSEDMLTEPIGDITSKENFLNFLVYGSTEKGVEQLVSILKQIEAQCGNTKFLRDEGKIAMDIDLLKYDNQRFHESDWTRDYIVKLMKHFDK
ncbi:MAG: 7,8-dihydro-6-hydroxymethylpterin-pyrophosphokinase [Prevotella stercorea]|nr:7,8-dihydro-6-hydroxymethylpterin-pyrophosphokinase [Leyella stercorea]